MTGQVLKIWNTQLTFAKGSWAVSEAEGRMVILRRSNWLENRNAQITFGLGWYSIFSSIFRTESSGSAGRICIFSLFKNQLEWRGINKVADDGLPATTHCFNETCGLEHHKSQPQGMQSQLSMLQREKLNRISNSYYFTQKWECA